MANPNTAPSTIPWTHTDKHFLRNFRRLDDAIRKNKEHSLIALVKEAEDEKWPLIVNLSEDPLLSVVIDYGMSDLAIKLIKEMTAERLEDKNYNNDTALHVAASKGDAKVAAALIEKNYKLLDAMNKQRETPLHKAALYGERNMFWLLVERNYNRDALDAVREDGATMLHCAIMGNAPELALEIAVKYPEQMSRRNTRAVTPLQVLVTIPEAFLSQMRLGPLDSLIYNCIPVDDNFSESWEADEEEMKKPSLEETSDESETSGKQYKPVGVKEDEGLKQKCPPNYAIFFVLLEIIYIPVRCFQPLVSKNLKSSENASETCERDLENKKEPSLSKQFEPVGVKEDEGLNFIAKYKRKFPPNYAIFFDLLELVYIPVGCFQLLIFNILKPVSIRIQRLEHQKKNHKAAMKLIAYLAKDPEYWDFIAKGRLPGEESKLSKDEHPDQKKNEKNGRDHNEVSRRLRWHESPLTLGAKMGLHEFVKQILTVCPVSAIYLDEDGKNVLQVAIEHGQEKIVQIIESMASGSNPVLPSWLLSKTHKNSTILHFASQKTVEKDAPALQLQYELQWFEKVRQLVPKDLFYSRNDQEKTAQELFTDNHRDMISKGAEQLKEMGKTCSGLVAAVVFASSFSIPGEKDKNNNPVFLEKTAFKVFTHAYVIGLSCAATALVLFLSLINARYREEDFRRSLPTTYFFANFSFSLALVALLVAFTCNIYLNIYGGRKAETKDILPLVLELTVFPTVCALVLLYRGSAFQLGTFFHKIWR